MQDKEPYNNLVLPKKRINEDLSVSDGSIWKYKDLGKSGFRADMDLSGKAKVFWYINNIFEETRGRKLLFSDWFETGDTEQWRLIIWPNKKPNSTGLYVQLKIDNSKLLYKRQAHINLKLYSVDDVDYIKKNPVFGSIKDLNLCEIFTISRVDWGYDDFIQHDKLSYQRKSVLIQASINSISSYENSKLNTGYVGIVNEGNTCYVNSLIQTLFFLTSFRNAVYLVPTDISTPDKLLLSLQLIFYHLEFKDTPASARDLLTSFGVSSTQWNTQQDVHEFKCFLSETLEKSFKGAISEQLYTDILIQPKIYPNLYSLSNIFLGKMKKSIVCINTNYKSSTIENFNEIQLNVKGCTDIYQSLDKFIEVEELTGENQYDAQGLGKQDARKEIIFETLPKVLQIQLKRFEYDYLTGRMAKVNDRHEFYEEINLSKYTEDKANVIYKLFSVIVHTGTATEGHYLAYISPGLDGNWFRFNDDSVDKAVKTQALESNFGGNVYELVVNDSCSLAEVLSKSDRSAYMLVYINSAYKDSVLEPSTPPSRLHELYLARSVLKIENQVLVENSSMFDIYLVARDMIIGWDKPGITPPDSSLYPSMSFFESKYNYKMNIPKSYTGKDLRIHLNSHIIGEFRLWSFRPGYRNWEFKELKLSDSLETELKNKALFIDVENDINVFKPYKSNWEFERNIEISTNSSQDTDIVDECLEIQTPSHAKAIVVYKWYDWNNGQPRLKLFKLVTLTSTANMSQIRNDLYTTWHKSTDNSSKMILYLEKCKIADNKNKETVSNIHTYKLEDNYELTISKRGTFGVRHVIVDNGDAFIGEVPPDCLPDQYIDAKKYINCICDDIFVHCVHYDRCKNTENESFGSRVLKNCNIMPPYIVNTKLSYTQAQFMIQLCELFGGLNIDQVQLYILKPNQSTPTLLPHSEDENKLKKGLSNTYVSSLLETSNSIYFDIVPLTTQAAQISLS